MADPTGQLKLDSNGNVINYDAAPAGATVNPQVASAPPTTPPSFSPAIPSGFSSDTVVKALSGSNPTADEINSEIAARSQNVSDYASTLVPTAEEQALQKKINDLTTQESTLSSATTAAELNYKDTAASREITQPIVDAQTAIQEELKNSQIQTIEAQKTNLNSQLSLSQAARNAQANALQVKIQNNTANINDYVTLNNIVQANNQAIQTRIDKLTSDAQNTLTNLLNNFGGLEWNDLSTGTQQQLTTLANQAGLPIAVLQDTLKNTKLQALAKSAQQNQTPDIQEYNYALQQGYKGSLLDWQKLQANLKAPKTTLSYTEQQAISQQNALKEVAPAVDALKGTDGYVNPYGFKELYSAFVSKNPGMGSAFLQNFPISIYVNPKDQPLFKQ